MCVYIKADIYIHIYIYIYVYTYIYIYARDAPFWGSGPEGPICVFVDQYQEESDCLPASDFPCFGNPQTTRGTSGKPVAHTLGPRLSDLWATLG